MNAPTPIPELLRPPGPFWTFNREERNACAILFGLLSLEGNLQRFADAVGWRVDNINDVEISVEWTYLRDLWFAHSQTSTPQQLKAAILDSLQPANRTELESMSILEFNTHFGAVPRPSDRFVQSPGNWSIARFSDHIADNDEFLRTCIFKWAFNVKPDLVLQTPAGQVLSIEAKWDSGEGRYPASQRESELFAARGVPSVSQTEVQRYLVNDLLGFDGTLLFLARRDDLETSLGRTVGWAQVLNALDRSGAPQFIQDWCAQEIAATS